MTLLELLIAYKIQSSPLGKSLRQPNSSQTIKNLEPIKPLTLTDLQPLETIPEPTPAIQSSPQLGDGTNTYDIGNCTWYAKSRRPDLPNNLGNANTWTYIAASEGYSTGSSPTPGAIGQKSMHVVYVESVNADGTMNISEMNEVGFNVVSSRTISPAGWSFIY